MKLPVVMTNIIYFDEYKINTHFLFIELAELFKTWDVDSIGHIQYSYITAFLGASAPSEESFKKFDTNGDGEYSLTELNKAFGFDTGK